MPEKPKRALLVDDDGDMMLPSGYHLTFVDDGVTLRRFDGSAIAFFPEDAPGADIVEVAWTDFGMQRVVIPMLDEQMGEEQE